MRQRGVLSRLAGLLLAAALAGCAHHPSAPPARQAQGPAHGYYKIGSPYQVDGVWYYPAEDYNYDETGIASWYGPDFHGKFTANGEVYNMNDLTAAHPTLPMPSVVRVTNLDNGRSIVVRVNDRGPYKRGRIIDLSRRAAQLLGMIGNGTAKVRVQILPDETRQAVLLAQQGQIPSAERIAAAVPTERVTTQALAPPPGLRAEPDPTGASTPRAAPRSSQVASNQPIAPPSVVAPVVAQPVAAVMPASPAPQVTQVPVAPSAIFVQVGAFTRFDNANRLRAKLSGLGPTRVSQAEVSGLPFFRVRVGPAASVADADQLLDRVVRAGYHDARIVVE